MEVEGNIRVGKLIETYVDATQKQIYQDKALSSITQKILSKEIRIQDVVVGLRDYLISKEGEIRARSAQLIAEILNTERIELTISEAITFAQFFGARLLDNASKKAVIQGLLVILENFPLEGDIKEGEEQGESIVEYLIRSIFNEMHIPSLPLAQRISVIQILSTILKKYTESINNRLGRDFVVGVVQTIDQEQDPRMLRECFKLVNEIVKRVPVYIEFKEEIFEVVSCYYPVDIKNSANQSNEQAEVIKGLNVMILETISASNHFMEYAIPHFLDLIAESPNEKKTMYFEAFVAIMKRFLDPSRLPSHVSNNEHPVTHMKEVWSIFRTEVFYSKDTEIIETALQSLQTITKLLSNCSGNKGDLLADEPITEFLNPILKDSLHQLSSPSNMKNDSKLTRHCIALLTALAGTDYKPCNLILSSSLPILLQLYESDDIPDHRLQVTRYIVSFLQSCFECCPETQRTTTSNDDSNGSNNNNGGNSNNGSGDVSVILRYEFEFMAKYKDQLFSMFSGNVQSAQTSTMLKSSAIFGLKYLVILSSFSKALLSEDDCKICVEILTNTAITVNTELDQSPKRRSLSSLVLISQYNNALICDVTIPKLAAEIERSLTTQSGWNIKESRDDDDWASDEEEMQEGFLKALCSLSTHLPSFKAITQHLLFWIKSLMVRSMKEGTYNPKLILPFIVELQSMITKVKTDECRFESQTVILPFLLSFLLSSSLIGGEEGGEVRRKNAEIMGDDVFNWCLQIISRVLQLSNSELLFIYFQHHHHHCQRLIIFI